MRRALFRFLNLFRSHAAEQDLAREIESHLALLQEEFERRGMPPEEARRAARREYGGVEQAREIHREARSYQWIEQTARDVKYGTRGLIRNPGFTVVAVLTLSLGIGANTAIFSVVNAVLLRPLAYKDADRLVTVLHGLNPVAPANYIDWRDQSTSFEAMAAAEAWSGNLSGSNPPEHLSGLRLTQNMLPMLGVSPLLGRVFAGDHEAVLSHRFWLRRFGGENDVLGKSLVLNGEAYTIVGVMPPDFKFAPFWQTRAELWLPKVFGESIHDRGGNSLRVFARLKPGVSLMQARADIATITARLDRQFPGSNRGVEVTPLKEQVTGKIEAPLLMVMVAVGFVLLIACANTGHMLLARTSGRQKEITMRIALGAGRLRIFRQFLTESLLLAGLGSLAGLALAYAGIRALASLAPAYLPRVDQVSIDKRVVLFLIGITLLTTLVFGMVPRQVKEHGRRGNRLRGFLVASEFALAFILMIGAGLMIRSFIALTSVDAGFDPHRVLSMEVSVAGTAEQPTGPRTVFYEQLLDRLRSMPGIESAGAINHLPLAGDMWGWSFRIEGRPEPRPGESPGGIYRVVMPGYFETMRLRLLEGRFITAADNERAPGAVVINERAVKEYWAGEDPVGKRITVDGPHRQLTIIGVVADAKQSDWAAAPTPEIYLPARQSGTFLGESGSHSDYITLVVRTAGDPAAMATAVKQAVWQFDKNLPISEVLTMEGVVRDANAQPRFEMLLLAVFAGVALILASMGIYGVMSYAVARRTREIGIRISLGASRDGVLRMLVRQAMMLAMAGGLFGVIGSVLLSKVVAKLLYGVRPTDPLTFAGVALTLGAAGLAAAYVPARRATRIEPMTALRHE